MLRINMRVLCMLGLLVACAPKAPLATHNEFYQTYAEPSGDGDVVHMLRGMRIADLRSGTARDALIDVVEAVAAECPPLAKSLFYIDCSGDPCAVFLAEDDKAYADAWTSVTCDDARLADFSTLSLERGYGDLSLAWVVGSPEGTDVVAATARFNETWPTDALQLEMARQLGLAIR